MREAIRRSLCLLHACCDTRLCGARAGLRLDANFDILIEAIERAEKPIGRDAFEIAAPDIVQAGLARAEEERSLPLRESALHDQAIDRDREIGLIISMSGFAVAMPRVDFFWKTWST